MLAKEEWRHDVVPEFLNGYNVRDFVDKDITEKLKLLEQEEELLLQEQERQRPELEVCVWTKMYSLLSARSGS